MDVEGGGKMALGDNCVRGGFCCNSVEHVSITTVELCELLITGLIIVHSLHSVHEGNAFSRVRVCLSIHSCHVVVSILCTNCVESINNKLVNSMYYTELFIKGFPFGIS